MVGQIATQVGQMCCSVQILDLVVHIPIKIATNQHLLWIPK